MYKKYALLILFLSVLIILPNFSLADTSADVQAKIQSIMAQIKALQDQLANLQAKQDVAVQWCHTFNTNLKIDDRGEEIRALHTALTKEGFTISDAEQPEKNNESGNDHIFGESTAAAVTGFQEKYRDEILTPAGLKNGTGYVGRSTRAKLNQLYGCGVKPATAPRIDSISPQSGPVGTQVTLTGSGFSTEVGTTNCFGETCPPLFGTNTVHFDGADISNVISNNGTSLTFTVPSGAPDFCPPVGMGPCRLPLVFQSGVFYQVSVSNANGNSNSANFFVSQPSQVVPSIQITSPAGGELWTFGTTHTITWTSSNVSNVNIMYSGCALPPTANPVPTNAIPASSGSGSGASSSTTQTQVAYPCVGGPVASSIPAQNGSYSWTIPTDLPSSISSYQLIISDAGANQLSVTSNKFSIISLPPVKPKPPTITVLSPNGGEVWQTGSTQTLKWAMPNDKIYRVEFYLMPQGSTPTNSTVAPGTSGVVIDPRVGGYSIGAVTFNYPLSQGNLTWTIDSQYPAGTYKIRTYLMPQDAATFDPLKVLAYDDSDAPFTIAAATAQNKLIVSVDSGTPIAANIPAGSTGQVIGAFKFSAPAQSQITLIQATLVDYVNSNPAVSADLKNFSLWDGGTQIGQTVPATVVPPSGITPGSMNFYNLSWVVPAGSSKVLVVKSDVSSTAAGNRHAIQLGGFGYAEPNIGSNWEGNGPFTSPSFNILPASACPSTYSAAVTLVPSTVAPNATGTAKILLSGSNPGGFAITLSGAATGQTNTLTWNNYNGSSCSAYYEVPFTAGQSSGAVNASLNFWGNVGSANLTVTSSATSNIESSALIASMAAMLNQMQEILKNMAR